MNILMTGGSGLLGRAFISRFSEYHYTVFTRSKEKTNQVLQNEVRHEKIRCIDSLDRLKNLDEFDAVINLAGEPIIDKRWTDKQKMVISQSRWGTTQQLAEMFASSKIPPRVFLSGSAIGVYGMHHDEYLDENSNIDCSDFPSQLCSQWENLAKQAAPFTRVVLLRTGIVLTPEGGALSKMLLPFRLGLGGRVGKGQQFMSWIHIQDYINALHMLMVDDRMLSAVNLVSPNAETNKSFTKTLAKVLKRPAIIPVPQAVLKFAMGESSCLLTGGQRVIPKALLDSGFSFQYPDLELALVDLLRKV